MNKLITVSSRRGIYFLGIMIFILSACTQAKPQEIKGNDVSEDTLGGYITIIVSPYEFNYKHQDKKFFLRLSPQLSFFDGYAEQNVVLREKADYCLMGDTIRSYSYFPRTSFTLSLESEYVYNYLVSANDTLTVTFKEDVPVVQSHNYANKDSDYSWQQPFRYPAYNSSFKSLVNERENYSKAVSYYIDFYRQVQSSIDSLYAKNGLSEDTYELARKDIASQLLYLKISARSLKTKDQQWSLFHPFVNDDFLLSSQYRSLVKRYSWHTANEKDPRKRFDKTINDTLFTHRTKAFVLFNILSEISEKTDYKSYESRENLFLNNLKEDSVIWKILIDNIKPIKPVVSEDMLLYNEKMEQVSFQDVKKGHLGKVIYVDIWASWCTPCMAAMPKAKELREIYSQDSILFLYLAFEDRPVPWKNNMERFDLTQDNAASYLIATPDAKFLKDIQLKTIPRYLIFDKKGELIQSNAPSPETTEIRGILDELLRQ